MRKQKTTLLICAFTFILLITAFYAAQRVRQNTAAGPETDETVSAEPEPIVLIDRSKSDIAEITFVNDTGEYTLIHLDPETNDGREWALKDYPDIPLAVYTVNNMTALFYYLSPSEILFENPDNLSDFGLDFDISSSAKRGNAPAHAQAVYRNGETETVIIGNKAPTGDFYYIKKDQDPAVYLLFKSYGDRLKNGYNEIIDKTIPQIDFTGLYYGEMREKGKPTVAIGFDGTKDEFAAHMESFNETILRTLEPFGGRDVYLSALLPYFAGPFKDYGLGDLAEMDCGDLSRYGLSDPALTIILEDKSQKLELLVGDWADADENTVYVCFAGKTSVFYMDAKYVSAFRDINPFKFIERFVIRPLPNIGTVDSIVLDAPEFDRVNHILINHQDDPPKTDGTGEIAPTVDNAPVDSEDFRMFYRAIIGLSVDAPAPPDYAAPPLPLATVTFNFNTGREPIVCRYYQYDENFYAVSSGGEAPEFLANKQVMKTSFEYLDACAKISG